MTVRPGELGGGGGGAAVDVAPAAGDPRGRLLGDTARGWWLRTVLVLWAPRPVFLALRRDADAEDARARRSEPVLLLVLVAGAAFVLSTRTAAHLMDDHDYDATLVAIWSFLAGALYGGIAYWLLGAVLHLVLVRLGSHGSYLRSRHLLAFAGAPIALSLVLFPFRIAIWGSALFHRGGADAGAGGKVFEALWLCVLAWSVGLLVVGVRAVHGWGWGRAVAGAAAPVAVAAALSLL